MFKVIDLAFGLPVVILFVGYICCEAALGYRQESWFRKDKDNSERWFV